jgi:arylsulfatase
VRGLLTVFSLLAVFSQGACDWRPVESGDRSEPRTAARHNVILFLVDTLRADHLGCYGYSRDTSPHLDEFAKDSTVFRNVTAQAPWTTPSVASLLTALYPSSHGLVTRLQGDRIAALDTAVVTLAEVLRAQGYQTAAFSTNPWITAAAGLDQGFETFVQKRRYAPAAGLHRAASRWMRQRDERPFFLLIHYMDVHGPYAPPPPFDRRFSPNRAGARELTAEELERLPGYLRRDRDTTLDEYVALYDGGISYWDHSFSEFLARPDVAGMLDNTVIIVTADHGEEFLEHGGFDHGETLYQEQISVPLIWRMPDHQSFEQSVHEPVELVDVMPTLLSLLGISPQPGQGRDQSSLMRGTPGSERPVFSEAAVAPGGGPHPGGTYKSVMLGDLKAIVNLDTDEVLYFDLSEDPGESDPLHNLPTPARTALLRHIAEWREQNGEVGRQIVATQAVVSPETREELEGLGYLEKDPSLPAAPGKKP